MYRNEKYRQATWLVARLDDLWQPWFAIIGPRRPSETKSAADGLGTCYGGRQSVAWQTDENIIIYIVFPIMFLYVYDVWLINLIYSYIWDY